MRRAALAIVIAMLTFSASGIAAFVVTEPCGTFEDAGRDHGDCSPTCVTCGCCAQAAEPVQIAITLEPETPVEAINRVIPPLPEATPGDILHVPKAFLS